VANGSFKSAWSAIVIGAGLLAVAGFAINIDRQFTNQLLEEASVEQTLDVLGKTWVLKADLSTKPGDGRPYILTHAGDGAAQGEAQFDATVRRITGDLDGLRGSIVGGTSTRALWLARLSPLVEARLASMRENLTLSEQGAVDPPGLAAMSRRGEDLMQQIDAVIEDLRGDQRSRLRQSEAVATASGRLIIAELMVCGGVAAVCGVVILMALLDRGRRLQYPGELHLLMDALDMRAPEPTTALARGEAPQRSYFDPAPTGLAVPHREPDGRPEGTQSGRLAGRLVHADLNPAGEALHGREREAVLDRGMPDIWPEPKVPMIEEDIEVRAAAGPPVQYVVASSGGPAISAVLDCISDVSQRRALEGPVIQQAEQQAEAAEREMAFFRNSVDSLFVAAVQEGGGTSLAGAAMFILEAVNPSFERMTGRKADRLIGHRVETCLTSATASTVLLPYLRCLEIGATVTYADTYLLADGKLDIEGSLTPIRHPGTGRIVRLAGLIRDVTERNRLEATRRQAQKMDAIGQLAAGVAHDFNNLLQSIVSGLELVLDDVGGGSPAHEFAELALHAANRGASLTRHLLAYARKLVLLPKPIEMASFLNELRQLLNRVLGAHISVAVRVAPDTPPIFADPGQLQTALLNLALNASHAMKRNGTLTIETHRSADANGGVVLTVADTGIGMDKITLVRATDPFFTTKGPGGTGLGLSMVKGFAEQSGGSLSISSQPGAGTKVVLTLPSAAMPPAHKPVPAGSTGFGRILLIDDVTDVVVTTCAFLEKAGFQVVQAKDGSQALAAISAGERFEAVVTDYAMPDMNGADLIAECRLIQPNLPAVIITGLADVEHDTLPKDVPVLHKPVARIELIRTIHRLMGSLVAEDQRSI
jgi:PAS domain S-box-containing protein